MIKNLLYRSFENYIAQSIKYLEIYISRSRSYKTHSNLIKRLDITSKVLSYKKNLFQTTVVKISGCNLSHLLCVLEMAARLQWRLAYRLRYIIPIYYFSREVAISSTILLYIVLSLFPNPILYPSIPLGTYT